MYEEVDLGDISLAQFPYTISGKKYILTEADGEAAGKYRSASLKGVELAFDDETGVRTSKRLEQIGDVEPLLVSRCLYEANPTDGSLRLLPDGRPDPSWLVALHKIKSWPARIQKLLFERIKDVSDLSEKDDLEGLEKQLAKLQKKIEKVKAKEDPSKNSHDSTTDGSA